MRSLSEIQAEMAVAKKRLSQLRAEEYAILLKYPCQGCGAPVGSVCRKIGGNRTSAHAERHKAAEKVHYERP